MLRIIDIKQVRLTLRNWVTSLMKISDECGPRIGSWGTLYGFNDQHLPRLKD